MAEVLLVNVDNSRVRTRCEVSVVSGYIDGRAPDAAVVVKTMQTVLGLQVPDVHLTANCKVKTSFVLSHNSSIGKVTRLYLYFWEWYETVRLLNVGY